MKPQTPSLAILLLGDSARTEFRDAASCLERWGAVHRFAGEVEAAAVLTAGRIAPDLIVVAQSFPGQFSHGAVDRLRRLAPLARVIGLMGSWCEGEMRTGAPWPAVVRNYWHQWIARCNRELHDLIAGAGGSWALPPTATEEERLLASAGSHVGQRSGKHEGAPDCRGLAVIRSRSYQMAPWLSDACRSRGFATVCEREAAAVRIDGAAVAIFDADAIGPTEFAELQRFAARLRPTPVIVLLAFPREEDDARARSAGAAVVLSKPVTVEDLFWELSNTR